MCSILETGIYVWFVLFCSNRQKYILYHTRWSLVKLWVIQWKDIIYMQNVKLKDWASFLKIFLS